MVVRNTMEKNGNEYIVFDYCFIAAGEGEFILVF